ncbi:MAG: SAM-dependent DNA methyltransferase, partial [Pseudomonas sp.]
MTQATHREPLDKALRRALEAAVVKARDIAELAATQALTRLSVGDAKPADYLNDQQRSLRTRLRTHGRQLGDSKQDNGQQSLNKLIIEVAYEHWHRMLFARFLEQNHLLMYDEHTPLTLAECNELVLDPDTLRDELERGCTSGWELAGVLASKMLPQIFRIDSPVFALEFAPEHQRQLEMLVNGLAPDIFQAQDSLGWVYQFWQSKRKEEVNKSEVKIGADELSPVTQLFTEPYMVSFLLDNSLGAWWAARRLTEDDLQNASSEEELRRKAAIPGVPLDYLRFIKKEDGVGHKRWEPAAGSFDGWPELLAEMKTLDPCCGSGHFLVAAFLMLVPMRMERDGLSAIEAVDAVLRENIHGLELDKRCVELAAFTLALTAWKYPNAGGYRVLPELNVACSGLSISAKKEDWLALAGNNINLRLALEELYKQFKDAPTLGSLINPAETLGKGSLFELKWDEVGPLLNIALAEEKDYERAELEVVAQGLSRAAVLLADKFHCIFTNPPFLGLERQDSRLEGYVKENFPYAKRELALCMFERIQALLANNGTAALVLPGEWTFVRSNRKFREKLLETSSIHALARLGFNSFITGIRANPVLIITSLGHSNAKTASLDISNMLLPEKPLGLIKADLDVTFQRQWEEQVDSRFLVSSCSSVDFEDVEISEFCDARNGMSAGDGARFEAVFWEVDKLGEVWEFLQSSAASSELFLGRDKIVRWEKEVGEMAALAHSVKHLNHAAQNWRRGKPLWGYWGVVVNQIGAITTTYTGQRYDGSCFAIVPNNKEDVTALVAYSQSGNLKSDLRNINPTWNLKSPKTLLQLKLDLERWRKAAGEEFPQGLPSPFSNCPNQWIFHGHPCGSVIWDEDSKWTAHGELRVDDSVLQVAVARLLGYRWPAELDPEMELAAEQREWVNRCSELVGFVDDDGIVCLPPVRGEKAADQRLEALMQAAYGDAWTTPLKNRLLEAVGSKSLSLWLRDKFFEQHCKLFQHRPFIWHIWDGLKDGFSVLVNYHKLDKAGLERLIYTYLGDWIRTQQAGLANGEDGAQERLAAAEALKRELEAILEGEKPYDIFVRWKPLAEQPIG